MDVRWRVQKTGRVVRPVLIIDDDPSFREAAGMGPGGSSATAPSVVRRYGFDQQAPQSHEQIGTWLGISEERSRQLEREALHRLRTIATARAA